MSEKTNKQIENLEKEVVVMENEAVEVVEVDKKAKAVKVAKKVGKIAAVAGVGILGYIIGSKASKKANYEESEIIDVEVEA